MRNKKLNMKSERLSRSLWLSDEFYVNGVSEKVVGKIYKNAARMSDYINTEGASLFPAFRCASTSNSYGLSTINGDEVNFIFYQSWTNYSISPESGKLFFMIPHSELYGYLYTSDNVSLSPSSHSGETIVIVANCHEGSSEDNRSLYGRPIAAAPFKIVNYEQFKEYLAKPEPNASKYSEIETLLAEMRSYEAEGNNDLTDCYFYVLDERYPELCSVSISDSSEDKVNGLAQLFKVYRSITKSEEFVNNSTFRFSVFPINSYNGAYARETAYEINSYDAMSIHSIIQDPTQADGWYWDGLGWKAWKDGEGVDSKEVETIVNNMSLTSVTTGAFRLPTIDYGELLAEYNVSTSSYYHIASCPWIRIMKIPNFHKDLVYNVVVPSRYDYMSDISDGNSSGSLYLSWHYAIIPEGGSITISRHSNRIIQDAYLKIDADGYLCLSLNLQLDKDHYNSASYTAAQIADTCEITTWLNSIYMIPSIKSDGYACNWKNYLSSCTVVASNDSRYPKVSEFNEADAKNLTLFSTTALSNINLGGSTTNSKSFSFMFVPSVSGTYELCVSIANPNSSNITCKYKVSKTKSDTTITTAPTATNSVTAGSSYNPIIFQFAAEANTPVYLYINSGAYYFNIDYLEIHGLVIMNTTDEGAQMPDRINFIKNTYYNSQSYTVTTGANELSNNIDSQVGMLFDSLVSPIKVTL